MFPGSSLLKLFAVMEESLDLNQFRSGDVHLWPIARSCFGAKKIDNNTAPNERPAELRHLDDAIDARYLTLIAASPPSPDRPQSAFGLEKLTRVSTGGGVLIFTRSEDHYLNTPRGFYAPVLDPWVGVAAERWDVRKVELAGPRFSATQPRVHATDSFQPRPIDQARVMELHGLLVEAETLALIVSKWLDQNLGYHYPNFADDLGEYLKLLWIEKEGLGELLDTTRPSLVLTSCNYLRPTASITWAARERGIPVADVQHGGNGPVHMGYNHWRHTPSQGYLVNPDLYFVWDAISANNIARWLPVGTEKPDIVVTGRFDLEATRLAYMSNEKSSPLDIATYGSTKTVLVTLQPLPSTGLTPLLLDVMKQAPADWTWLIRSHPMAVAWKRADMMPETIEATLRAHGIQRAECRFSTALPLAVLLPLVNHHVTGFSGTVQECAAFGIRTTFSHPSAHFSFPYYLDAGFADFATTPDSVLESIGRPAPDHCKMTEMPRDRDCPRQVLERILG